MVQPPFLYDRPSTYSFAGPTERGFNPKAVTQASWAPKAPRPQHTGPLIDFNKHPDTYVSMPYGNLGVKAMNPNTEDRVKLARTIQLVLRICALLASLGCLFCVIAINNISLSVAWILRISPGVALCHTLYGVYHFCRPANGRTPTSSAGYMVFAGMLDMGLIPFFGFAAFLAYGDYTQNTYGWSTLFGNNVVTYKVIFAYFILTASEGGLLVISLFLDMYLGVLFRKIAQMPPDMNPLEPNLTTRHKRNKSDMGITQQNMAGSALAARQSAAKAGNRRIPFAHTRTDSADSVTLYGNDSAKSSRAEFRKELQEMDKTSQIISQTSSVDTLVPNRPETTLKPDANARTPGAGLSSHPVRSSDYSPQHVRQPSWLSYGNRNGAPSPLSDAARAQLDSQVRPMSPVSAISNRRGSIDRADMERSNWYQSNGRNDRVDVRSNNKTRTDLSMNALNTTPTKPRAPQDENYTTYDERESDAMLSGNTRRTPLGKTDANAHGRPSSFVGTPGKSRFYGNLNSPVGSAKNSPTRYAEVETVDDVDDHDGTHSLNSDTSGNIQIFGSPTEDEEYDRVEQNHATGRAQVFQTTKWYGKRQVSSSTGYDLQGGYAGLGAEFGKGMGRRRDVSGKVAEEGRGNGYGGLDDGVTTSQPNRNAAAGWARFKGL